MAENGDLQPEPVSGNDLRADICDCNEGEPDHHCHPMRYRLVPVFVTCSFRAHRLLMTYRYRKRLMDDHLPHRKMVEVELADAVIRIADLAEYLDLDLGGAVMEKLEYNRTRADHKPENRAKAGGKAF